VDPELSEIVEFGAADFAFNGHKASVMLGKIDNQETQVKLGVWFLMYQMDEVERDFEDPGEDVDPSEDIEWMRGPRIGMDTLSEMW